MASETKSDCLRLACRAMGFFCVLFSLNAWAVGVWQEVAPGIEYQDLLGGIITPWSHVHTFRVDLNKNKLGLVTAKNLMLTHASVEQFAQQANALIGINGGFFDRNYKPLGLRIADNKRESPLRSISWWGVFYVKSKKAYLSSLRNFNPNEGIEFAIQSGPRLLVNGAIPPLKRGSADRSALGITAEGKVILLVSNNAAMSTRELAQLMKSPPLSCLYALNLDGGSSSQLYAHVDSFLLQVRGFTHVSDAVVVKPLSE